MPTKACRREGSLNHEITSQPQAFEAWFVMTPSYPERLVLFPPKKQKSPLFLGGLIFIFSTGLSHVDLKEATIMGSATQSLASRRRWTRCKEAEEMKAEVYCDVH